MPVSKKTVGSTVSQPQAPNPITPYWQSDCGRAVVYVGDCRDVMAKMEPEQFHAVVTDPPYGLGKEPDVVEVLTSWLKCGHHEVTGGGFMGKKWDAFVPQPATWQECVRVMKPGAHMLCFAGTRTLDWMAMGLRFAGLEYRDLVMYCYSSGFPKGINVSKAIDKELGAKRDKIRTPMRPSGGKFMEKLGEERPWKNKAKEVGYHEHDSDEPATEAAEQWDGWNTSLKPAIEPIILARRPFSGTVAQCAMKNCTGAMNVESCLIGTDGGCRSSSDSLPNYKNNVYGHGFGGNKYSADQSTGRWPANLIHDGSEEVVELFPHSISKSATMPLPQSPGQCHGEHHGNSNHAPTVRGFNDSGSSARFFYTTKANDDDRPHGKGKHVTTHPTVKPLDLMKYLVRLVCVRGGTVLDPFMGSGSTGCAAIAEGMRFVGIEQSQEYADIAVGRLKLALNTAPDMVEPSTNGKASSTGGSPLIPKRLE